MYGDEGGNESHADPVTRAPDSKDPKDCCNRLPVDRAPWRDRSGSDPQQSLPSINECLELLADRRRREILAFFLDSGKEHASIEEIVSEIADDRADATGTGSDRDSVVAELHRVHLPMLAYAWVLEYDIARHDIRYRGDPRIEELYSKIRELQEPE